MNLQKDIQEKLNWITVSDKQFEQGFYRGRLSTPYETPNPKKGIISQSMNEQELKELKN